MKKKEYNELRGKNIKELRKIVIAKKNDEEKAKMKILGGKEKNLKLKRNLSSEIAKILTLIREKEIIEKLTDANKTDKNDTNDANSDKKNNS